MKLQRRLQIGVMGSVADLQYSDMIERIAEEIGSRLAAAGAVTVFGAEKDCDSLSTAACRGAKRAGGWSEQLADTYIDERNRRLTIGATTPKEAVDIALREAGLYRRKYDEDSDASKEPILANNRER